MVVFCGVLNYQGIIEAETTQGIFVLCFIGFLFFTLFRVFKGDYSEPEPGSIFDTKGTKETMGNHSDEKEFLRTPTPSEPTGSNKSQ